jgi:flagellar motility protein MotE (MotC chaperone)
MVQKKYSSRAPADTAQDVKSVKKKPKRPQLHEIIRNKKEIKNAKKEQQEKLEKQHTKKDSFTKQDEEEVVTSFETMFDQMRDIAKKKVCRCSHYITFPENRGYKGG